MTRKSRRSLRILLPGGREGFQANCRDAINPPEKERRGEAAPRASRAARRACNTRSSRARRCEAGAPRCAPCTRAAMRKKRISMAHWLRTSRSAIILLAGFTAFVGLALAAFAKNHMRRDERDALGRLSLRRGRGRGSRSAGGLEILSPRARSRQRQPRADRARLRGDARGRRDRRLLLLCVEAAGARAAQHAGEPRACGEGHQDRRFQAGARPSREARRRRFVGRHRARADRLVGGRARTYAEGARDLGAPQGRRIDRRLSRLSHCLDQRSRRQRRGSAQGV